MNLNVTCVSELVDEVAKKAGVSKKSAKQVLDIVGESWQRDLKAGLTVILPGKLGRLVPRIKQGGTRVVPLIGTSEKRTIVVPTRTQVAFKPTPAFKEGLRSPPSPVQEGEKENGEAGGSNP